jgi:hypothetical protein
VAKTKRTNSVLQNITKKIKDQQGTHTNPEMTFGGRKNVFQKNYTYKLKI